MTDNRDDGRGPRSRDDGPAGDENPSRDDSPWRQRPPRPESAGDRPMRRPQEPGAGRMRPERPAAKARPADPHGPAPEASQVLPVDERIAKVIARAGIASRRDAEALIAAGRVTLNGQRLESPAVNVGPDDTITVDGEALPLRERTRLWLFHKPRGLVTTFRDPQGRPTVFEALPEEMPRVVAIGRLDINTEGLLLLTNDGGLAKVVAHPETGWTRRYRVRARGEVSQAELDKLRGGVSIDGMDYGPIEASLDRVQGDNCWLTLALREGKNREVKRILEHVGLQVNRLIRLSFGPFQLGELEAGLVDEVKTKVLRDQLGATLAQEAGVDFTSPVREPIAPFGSDPRETRPSRPARMPDPRRAGPEARDARPARRDDRVGATSGQDRPDRRPARGGDGPSLRERPKRFERPTEFAWRDEGSGADTRSPRRPRTEPKADRVASAARPRERMPAIDGDGGRKIRVERVVARPDEARPARDGAEKRPYRPERPRRDDRPQRDDRSPRGERPAWQARTERPKGSAPGFGRPKPDGRAGPHTPRGDRPFGTDRPAAPGRGGPRGAAPGGGDRFKRDRPTGDPGAKRSFGARPPRDARPGDGRSRDGRPGGSGPRDSRPTGGRPGGARPGGKPRRREQ